MSVLVGRDKTKRDTYTISSLLEAVRLKQIRDDHKQQRDPDQFSDDYRDGFISTIVKNEDFDPIKLCEQITEMGVINWLIDGKQRLTTIQSFVMGGFCLGQNIENPIIKYLENTVDGEGNPIQKIKEFDLRGKGYTDLPPELKLIFDNYNVLVVKHLDCTDDEIGYHIRRYNRQVNMNGNQKAITYINTVAGDIKKVATHRFFKDCVSFKGKDRINGTSERIVIESLMFLNHFDSWKKDAKRQGMFLDTNSKKEDFEELNSLLDELQEVVEDRHLELFKKKNSFLWISFFKEFKKYNLDNSRFDEFLTAFENGLNEKLVSIPKPTKISRKLVNECSFNDLDAERSSKDKGYISTKIHIMKSLMEDYLKEYIEESKSEKENVNDNTEVIEENNVYKENTTNSVLDFIKENVSDDIDERDLECFEDTLDDLTIEVDNNSKLLESSNIKSLLAIVAYSFKKDEDLDKWFPDYFSRNDDYFTDQKENFLYMKEDFDKYLQEGEENECLQNES